MNELVVVGPKASEIAPLQHEIDAAARRRDSAEAGSTRRNYNSSWSAFTKWAVDRGVDALPANPQAVATYLNTLAESGMSLSSIGIARAAIVWQHRRSNAPFDDKHPDLSRVMKGIRRDFAKTQKSAAPMLLDDLRAILGMEDKGDVAHIRDKAMFALGFAHALRGPSELLELDYAEPGDGRGHIEMTRDGIVINLRSSKASEGPETLVVDSANVRAVVARWIVAGDIRPGAPLFQRIRKGGQPAGTRLTGEGLTKIMRARVAAMLRAQGQTEAEATTVARAFSTHSMRRGAATSMAKAGANGLEIAGITRHASMAMVKRYCDLGGQNYAAMKRLGV